MEKRIKGNLEKIGTFCVVFLNKLK